ncbi:hypothetical protein THERMOT_1027 [Bathymodiolus thermophilus thioautotrophic gill symbiont]|uniref:Uncharacterized protein n=1 Tax=Bathymodiolus thermophilus thioautotrophic gill symbiont TaxID=2360 RepID=A0A8H8XCJ9_9GAMM|nr:hypothetical protein THERMOS_408 [Bathymodiolus thermophilus thioautotrophic gill symbiont]CAB5499404.1 hypothetical protein THERMOT_1027 [Bathymodiolus thermophilus thioautotrophic gill symbiont]
MLSISITGIFTANTWAIVSTILFILFLKMVSLYIKVSLKKSKRLFY